MTRISHNVVLYLAFQFKVRDRQSPTVEQRHLYFAGSHRLFRSSQQIFSRTIGPSIAMQHEAGFMLAHWFMREKWGCFKNERDLKFLFLIGPGAILGQLHINGKQVAFTDLCLTWIADNWLETYG